MIWMRANTVRRDLLRLAKQLRLVNMDAGESDTTSRANTRTVTSREVTPAITSSFPAWMASDKNVTLNTPALILSFHNWYYIGPQLHRVFFAGDDYWLRLVVTASAVDDLAYSTTAPHAVTVDPTFRFEWTPTEAIMPANASGSGYGDPCDYYIYLVRVADGRIAATYPTTFVSWSTSIQSDPPG